MRKCVVLGPVIALIVGVIIPGLVLAQAGKGKSELAMVLLPNSSPLVSFRILFNTGSASDPKGKEGVAALTAALIAEGGSREMAYAQIVEAMYPMAAQFSAQVDKEMTVFYGTTHIDNLEKYYRIISGMLLDPGWRQDDFVRLKENAINFLKVNIRGNNDEELGKEALYNFIYEGHPYGHYNVGTVEAIEKLTVDDLKSFYRDNYTAANFVLGLAGGYPTSFEAAVRDQFSTKLAPGKAATPELRKPASIAGLQVQIIQKDAPGTAISFGYPIAVTRADADWPALLLVQSYLGQHRSSNSHLYQRMRQIRGLNYGDYAYIEYFPRGMFQFHPDSNLGRRQQIFQVWIRPVEPKNSVFSLRIALYELRKLVEGGMSKEDFEATRLFLTKFVNVLTKTQDAQLGYALDSRYYGIPNFNDYVRDRLSKITVEEVNRVIKRHLQSENIKIVVVTRDADAFKTAVVGTEPSPITYASLPPKEILEEDKVIEKYPLKVKANAVRILPIDQVFQR